MTGQIKAQNKSIYPEWGERQHLVLRKDFKPPIFEAVGDRKLAELKAKHGSLVIWCGGFYNGAFTG